MKETLSTGITCWEWTTSGHESRTRPPTKQQANCNAGAVGCFLFDGELAEFVAVLSIQTAL